MPSRYDIGHLAEAQFEPGSHQRVLKNLPGIHRKREMATLMALQAGLPLLNFSGISGRKKEAYFAAVQAGLARDYVPMEKVFRSVVEKTLKGS
jgi:hypothetical protein